LSRRDREIAEHKLVVARAELRLLQQIYGLSVSGREQQDPVSKLSMIMITNLVDHFSGDSDDFENWE